MFQFRCRWWRVPLWPSCTVDSPHRPQAATAGCTLSWQEIIIKILDEISSFQILQSFYRNKLKIASAISGLILTSKSNCPAQGRIFPWGNCTWTGPKRSGWGEWGAGIWESYILLHLLIHHHFYFYVLKVELPYLQKNHMISSPSTALNLGSVWYTWYYRLICFENTWGKCWSFVLISLIVNLRKLKTLPK